MLKIGILALQGDFQKHALMLEGLPQTTSSYVRQTKDLKGLDALIIPGGESTTISKLLQTTGLYQEIKNLIEKGLPIFATCAGMILLSSQISQDQNGICAFEALDISIYRNAYGPQIESFAADLQIEALGQDAYPAIFIRSPLVEKVGSQVSVLATHNEKPVLCTQNNILAASFHPELTDDIRLHKFFLDTLIKTAV